MELELHLKQNVLPILCIILSNDYIYPQSSCFSTNLSQLQAFRGKLSSLLLTENKSHPTLLIYRASAFRYSRQKK